MHPLFVSSSLFLAVAVTFGQSDRGTVTGTVSDATGAVIPGASVVATNTETAAKYETISTDTGNYTLSQLPAAVYQMCVELPGFKRYVRQGLTVLVAQTLRIDVALEVGTATDEVTVNADAPLLRTESSDVSYLIKAPEELPIFGVGGNVSGSAGIRNPYAIVQMVPGSTWTPNSLVRLNGTPANTQSWRIEGQDASNSGTPGVPAQSQPSVDAIQEVAIQTSNFAAEYGQVGGGVFNVTMKSCTNQFHGTAYEYLVNEAFNAGNPFTDTGSNPRPRARRHDYGFTFGGPIRRDKTFFYASFEQFRETTVVNNAYQTVPTLAYRNGDFRTGITSRVIGKGRLSFFWQRTNTSNPNGNTTFGRSDGLPDPITEILGTFQHAPLYRLNYDHTVTPTILLHLGAGYRSNYFFVPSVTTKGQITNYNAEKELGLRGGIENKFFPTMSGFLATNGTGGMKTIGSEAGTNQITQSPTFNANLSWVKNNHTYKFGSEFRTEGYPP